MSATESSIAEHDGVREHYDGLLAGVYTWMIGGLTAAEARARAVFDRLGVTASPTDENPAPAALDIGSGPGPQALALASMGFRVTGLEPCEPLLSELREAAAARGLKVTAVADGVPLEDRYTGPFAVISCMVDTLVSLPDVSTAHQLIADAARRLEPGGKLCLSFRDLTQLPVGNARFLPVRSDANRILTCFLEGVDDARVRVHDVLHERSGEGFTQRVSSYLKLRQVSTRSPLGAIALHTGGLVIDDGWLRVLGSGSAQVPRSLDEWNGLRSDRRCDAGLMVADDVLGGFFCWFESPRTIHYLAPDTLEWEDLELGYTDWLHWCFSDRLASFYGELRWEGWQAEVGPLAGDRGLHVWPPLFSKGPPIAERSRKPVPVEELWSLALDFGKQLRGVEDCQQIRVSVESAESGND
jgi:SAM-dependent methyltransferase